MSTTILTNLSTLLTALLDPLIFLSLSLTHLPSTITTLYRQASYSTLLSPTRLRAAWFTRFWSLEAGPNIRANNGPRISALLAGRVSGGVVCDDVVGVPIGGRVVDVGPGSGFWVDLFAAERGGGGDDGVRRRRRDNNNDGGNGITKIYGVEPNTQAHASLLKHIRAAGLEGKYEIVSAGIEALSEYRGGTGAGAGIEEGSVDCVVTMLCLCSIPDPERNIRMLYRYLKKGGRWYLYEHVRVGRSWWVALYQSELFVCSLCGWD